MKIKTKTNKWDLTKFESFCTAKETRNKMKRQPLEMEQIFANEATDKTPNKQTGLAAQYQKKRKKKKTIQSKNGWKITRHFSKKTY